MPEPGFHMWFVLIATLCAVISFAREKVPLEVTSIAILTALLLFGQFFPLYDGTGRNQLDSMALLSGFSNPSLIAVLALLVIGQGMIRTDSLRILTEFFAIKNKKYAWIAIAGFLLFIMFVSAFVNNTPLVVIGIPLMQILAHSAGVSESRVMIPLSYAAILGGMMTLVGSSTNLLVSSSMTELGHAPLTFFEFAVPGSMLAGAGFLYVIFILPHLLPDRRSMARDLAGGEKEFVAELDISPDSSLIGMECEEGKFSALEGVSIKLIQRGGHLILPPFEGYNIEAGDVLIVAATRETLAGILSKYPGFLLSEEEAIVIQGGRIGADKDAPALSTDNEVRVLAEIMITPASRILDMSLDHVGFHRQFGTIVLGIQRRARVVRRRLGRIRLEPGDVLLVAGRLSVIDSLRNNPDFIVLSGSKKDLPVPKKAPLAAAVFLGTIGAAALGVISIAVAAITGAVLMVAIGCLNVRQALRALDRKIFLLVGSMLALGTALQVTGGAEYLAEKMLALPYVDTPLAMGAALFAVVALVTNILSNNACAILFTPIALSLADRFSPVPGNDLDLGFFFAITVLFAANCSFATPIGYQTNLLVMGPGHYRFSDFLKSGVPLVLVLWLTYICMAKFYFGL